MGGDCHQRQPTADVVSDVSLNGNHVPPVVGDRLVITGGKEKASYNDAHMALAKRLGCLRVSRSIFALFKERMLLRWFGPRLTLHHDSNNGADFHFTTGIVKVFDSAGRIIAQGAVPCLYVRLQVRNTGPSTAEMVEIAVIELYRRDAADSDYRRVNTFLPLNLKWSHTGSPYRERVPRDVTKYCDLFHILEPGGRASAQINHRSIGLGGSTDYASRPPRTRRVPPGSARGSRKRPRAPVQGRHHDSGNMVSRWSRLASARNVHRGTSNMTTAIPNAQQGRGAIQRPRV